jgi:hypothetical protein
MCYARNWQKKKITVNRYHILWKSFQYFSTFLIYVYLQAGVVRGRFYWALLWNTYAVRNPVPTALETQRQTDQYSLWDRQSKEADEQTLWQRGELYFTKLTVFWHIFISHVLANNCLSCFGTHLSLMFWYIFIYRVLAHIYILCLGTYLSRVLAHIYLIFWHIFVSHALAHIYLCFCTYLSLVFWHIYISHVLAHIYFWTSFYYLALNVSRNSVLFNRTLQIGHHSYLFNNRIWLIPPSLKMWTSLLLPHS